jgi:hypothetical protein
LTGDGQNFEPPGGVTVARPLSPKSYLLCYSRISRIARTINISKSFAFHSPHVLFVLNHHLVVPFTLYLTLLILQRPSAVVGCPSIAPPYHSRLDSSPTATSTTSRHFSFIIQQPLWLPLRRSLPSPVPSPSADQHRARVSSLVRRIGVALSVSGTGAPNLSLILLTLSNRFIVLLVRLVTTSGAATRPRLLAPRTLVPTYASCSAPRVCLAFSPIDFPLP